MRFKRLDHVTLCGIGLTALTLAFSARPAVAQVQDAAGSQSLAIAHEKPDPAIELSPPIAQPQPEAAVSEECEKQASKPKTL
jgi:hypothetical protein